MRPTLLWARPLAVHLLQPPRSQLLAQMRQDPADGAAGGAHGRPGRGAPLHCLTPRTFRPCCHAGPPAAAGTASARHWKALQVGSAWRCIAARPSNRRGSYMLCRRWPHQRRWRVATQQDTRGLETATVVLLGWPAIWRRPWQAMLRTWCASPHQALIRLVRSAGHTNMYCCAFPIHSC